MIYVGVNGNDAKRYILLPIMINVDDIIRYCVGVVVFVVVDAILPCTTLYT